MAITINVNGQDRRVDAAPGTPLLWVLRDHLKMTGTKFGCGIAQCGACTVYADGVPIRACITEHDSLDGAAITTIEGVQSETANAVRAAWVSGDVPQCGYCQSGQIMAAIALLEEVPIPTDEDIDWAMSGNLCRCASYMSIRRAIMEAASQLQK